MFTYKISFGIYDDSAEIFMVGTKKLSNAFIKEMYKEALLRYNKEEHYYFDDYEVAFTLKSIFMENGFKELVPDSIIQIERDETITIENLKESV